MKLVQITYHFQYAEAIERILDQAGLTDYVRLPMVQARDRDGKHYGTKVFPGSSDLVMATVPDDRLEGLLEALRDFREERESHRHLQALVLPVAQRLGAEGSSGGGDREEDRGAEEEKDG